MPDIGMSTSCFYPLETEKSLEKVCKLGFGNVEMFINSYIELDEPFISEYKKLINEYGINLVSIHTTASFADGYNYFSDYYRRFKESIEVFKKYVELANLFSTEYLVMHGLKNYMKHSDALYCERFSKLIDIAYENGVSLLQENVVDFRSESPDYIDYMKKSIGERFAMTLDIKQCRRAGYDPFEFIERHHGIIKHIHISDYNEYSDCITPLKGNFDFGKLFETMNEYGYDGSYIIELYKHSYKDENEIKEAGIKLSKMLKRAD